MESTLNTVGRALNVAKLTSLVKALEAGNCNATPGRTVLVAFHGATEEKVECPGVVTGVYLEGLDIFVFPCRKLLNGICLQGIGQSESGEPEYGRWRFPPQVGK